MTAVHTTRLASELDDLLFSDGDVYDAPRAESEALRDRLVAASYLDHLDRCSLYRDYARRRNGSLDGPVPARCDMAQIPTGAFKRRLVVSARSGPVGGEGQVFASSGTTSGLVSRVWRDDASLYRLLGSVRTGLGLLAPYLERDDLAEAAVVHLGPPSTAASEVWLSYVLSLTEILAPTTHWGMTGRLDLAGAIDAIVAAHDRGSKVVVFGAPFAVAALAGHIQRAGRPLRLGDGALVVTGGGWKSVSASRRLPRSEFDAVVVEQFGLVDDTQVRDSFNQVELNTVLLECEAKGKHLPPWLDVIVRHLRTLEPVADGASGILSFLDPTSSGFPAFIIGDDIGRIETGPCACGRRSSTLIVERRLERSWSDGCARKLAVAMDDGP